MPHYRMDLRCRSCGAQETITTTDLRPRRCSAGWAPEHQLHWSLTEMPFMEVTRILDLATARPVPLDDWGYSYRRRVDAPLSLHRMPAPRAIDINIPPPIYSAANLTDETHIWINPTPKETTMEPYSRRMTVSDILNEAHRELFLKPMQQVTKTPEQTFRELDVQAGDRIRLTESRPVNVQRPNGPRQAVKDGSSLEGKVLDVKVRGGKSQVRVAAFGHTGPSNSGGQHVWFPVDQYVVEVLHKVYRLNDEDRAIAAVLGYDEPAWIRMTDDSREALRKQGRPRLEKVRAALGVAAPSA